MRACFRRFLCPLTRMTRFGETLLVIAAVGSGGACSGESSPELERIATIEQPFKNQFFPGYDPVHESVTLAALPFLKQRVANYLAYQNASFDAFNILDGDAHFDNCLFSATSERTALNMRIAVASVLEFPDNYENLPEDPLAFGLPAPHIPGGLSMASFAAVLHSMQDFYSHTNWVENGKRTLFNRELGELPPIQPYSNIDGLVVLDEASQGWSVHSASRTAVYPESVLVTARYRRDVFPVLLSGETGFSFPSNCPTIHGPGLTEIDHGYLAKDDASHHPSEHVIAVGLATQQTTHEWCRFQNLVYQRHGTSGIDFLCENWVENVAEANDACPALPSEARCAGANLVPVRMCGPTAVSRGSRLVFDFSVRNDGSEEAPAGAGNESDSWVGLYYLSVDPEITTADLRVGGFTTQPALGPGESWSVSDGADIPSSVSPGTYFLGMILDPADKLAETDEADNTITYCGSIQVQ